MAWLMDDKFRIGGTRFRFGLDPVINMIPFLGTIIGFVVACFIVLVIWRHGASRKLIMLMLINVIIDLTLGAIPVIGHVFDFVFKANRKNLILLQQYHYQGKHQGKGNDILMLILGVFLLLTCLFIYLLWSAFMALIGLL